MTLYLTKEEQKYLVNSLQNDLDNEDGYRGYIDYMYAGMDQKKMELDFQIAKSILKKLLKNKK